MYICGENEDHFSRRWATCRCVSVRQVVGVQDARMGEEVCACIKLVDGQESTAEEIKDYCKGQVRHSSLQMVNSELESFAAVIVSAHRLLLLIPDFSLQDPSLRTFCHQLPAHHHRKGTFSNPKLTYSYKKYKWQTNKVYFTVFMKSTCIQTKADV